MRVHFVKSLDSQNTKVNTSSEFGLKASKPTVDLSVRATSYTGNYKTSESQK